jgi:hypothetical protein
MTNVAAPPPQQDFLAGLLSYLVPGLGQLYQGRIGKGILFLAGIYGLFFYGMYLGNWQNVYLPQAVERPDDLPPTRDAPIDLKRDLIARPQFLGQFWTGLVSWPAIVQYVKYDRSKPAGPYFGTWERTPYESRQGALGPSDHRGGAKPVEAEKDYAGKTVDEQQTDDDKSYDIGWVCTVVAGVLNILVVYDAFAGPAITAEVLARAREEQARLGTQRETPVPEGEIVLPTKRRHVFLSAILLLIVVVNGLSAVTLPFAIDRIQRQDPKIGAWQIWLAAFMCALAVVCAIAIYNWKKWGFYGILAIATVSLIVTLATGVVDLRSGVQILEAVVLTFIGPGLLFGALQCGEEKTGWEQLE